MGRQCLLCHHTCHECTDEGPDHCTSCDKDKFGVLRYLFEGQCREVCPEGFFPSGWKRCESCPAACIMCTAADRCLQCSPGHKLRYGRCVPLECMPGEVPNADNDNCIPCDEFCERCKHADTGDANEMICLKCEPGFYQLGTDCHRSCPDRTYNATETMQCAPCEDKHCQVCDQSQCYLCEDKFYVSAGECVDRCEEGFFVDEESQECEPCHRACRSCGGPRYDDCDSCEDGYTLKNGECLEGRELILCPENHFRGSENKCELCHSICKTCFGAGKEECSSCYPDRFLTAQQTCMARCPSGTFGNKTSRKCQDCMKGCVTCQDTKQCQRCRSRLYLHNGLCVATCPRGFPQGDVCQPCAPECASCKDSPTTCVSCETQYFLLDHSCKDHCPDGYYADEKECHLCSVHCAECNQDGLCKKCAQYYFLHDDRCVDDCPVGYFPSEKEQECVQCHSDCASCDGPDLDDCGVCRNPKAVRYNGECLPRCPSHTYYDRKTNECRDCDRSCLTCSGYEPSSCLTCDTNLRKDASGHCVPVHQCPLTSFVDREGACQSCHSSCHRCSGPGKDLCLSCNTPRFLLNSTCVQQCPAGFYAEDKDERVCERCHFSCQSCVGHHSVQCLACKPGLFKQGPLCVQTCSDSHFGNNADMTCQRCDPSCSKCWGPGTKNCVSCRVGYVFMRPLSQCLKRCPAGYYKDKWSATCHKCHPTCKTCSGEGALACQSCYGGFIFSAGICHSQCLVGFYTTSKESQINDDWDDEQKCEPCDQSCLDCRGPGMWNCIVCQASKILSDDGRCLSCCGSESDGHEPIPRECCDCESSPVECVMGVNFVMKTSSEGESSPARIFVTACVLFILCVGGGIFAFLNARSKTAAVAPKTKAGGYASLSTNGGSVSQPSPSPYGEYSDRIIHSDDDEEEEDEEEDIVYMGQDGTVYRKFKYGLLEGDEIDLEYDDENYSYK